LPLSYKRFAVAFFIQLFILFGGFVIIGMLLQNMFLSAQTIFLLVFSLYGIISSTCWLLEHKKEAYVLQVIMQKKLQRTFQYFHRRLQEKLE